MESSRTSKSNNSNFHTWHNPTSLTSSSSSSLHSSSSFASSTALSFYSRCASSSTAYTRSTSPTRVSLYGYNNNRSQSPTISFSINDRSTSPGRSISIKRSTQSQKSHAVSSNQKRTCLCSPTTHPGSFRCAFHRSLMKNREGGSHGNGGYTSSSYHSGSALNLRRSAMTNSLVRIGGVEGELVKRALTALIRPSSHQLRRRAAFEPKPSRLSVMSKADDL